MTDQSKVSELDAIIAACREHADNISPSGHWPASGFTEIADRLAALPQPQATTVGMKAWALEIVDRHQYFYERQPAIWNAFVKLRAEIVAAAEAALIGIPGAEKGEDWKSLAGLESRRAALAIEALRQIKELAASKVDEQAASWAVSDIFNRAHNTLIALKTAGAPAPTSERVQALEDALLKLAAFARTRSYRNGGWWNDSEIYDRMSELDKQFPNLKFAGEEKPHRRAALKATTP